MRSFVNFKKLSEKIINRIIFLKFISYSYILVISHSASCSDLLSLYQSALFYDAQYSATKAQRDASNEKKPQALAGLLPTLSISASSTWTNQDTTLKAQDAQTITNRYNDRGWSAQLTQPIFRSQNLANYKQAQIVSVGAEIELQKANQDLMIKVSKAYFDVLMAMENINASKLQLKAIREQLETARRGFTLGTTTITDTHEAQARFDLQTAIQIATNSDLIIKEKILKNICGEHPINYFETFHKATLWRELRLSDERPWVDAASKNNLDVRLGENLLEIATREVEKRRANHLPTIDLIGTYDNTTYSETLSNGIQRPGNEINASGVGLQMRIPIYSGGLTNAQTREALALRQKALDGLDDTRRRSMLSAQESFQNVIAGLAQINAYEAALKSSEAALDANKRGYELGMRLSIDILNAQSQAYDAKLKLLRARFDTILAYLNLKAATGLLAISDLEAMDQLLE